MAKMAISAAKKAQRKHWKAERQHQQHEAEILKFIENETADDEDELECGDDLHRQL